MSGWVAHYWHWAGGNIGAMPAQALIAAAVARGPLRRILRRVLGVEEARLEAAAARRIAADLYRLHYSRDHPQAPARPDGAGSGRAGQ